MRQAVDAFKNPMWIQISWIQGQSVHRVEGISALADVSSLGKILLWKHMVMVFLSPITDVNAMFVYGNG